MDLFVREVAHIHGRQDLRRLCGLTVQPVQDLLRRQVHAVDLGGELRLAVLAPEIPVPLRDDQADEVDRALLAPRERLLPPQWRSAGAGLGAVDARERELLGWPSSMRALIELS